MVSKIASYPLRSLTVLLAILLIISIYSLIPVKSEQQFQRWEQALTQTEMHFQSLAEQTDADKKQQKLLESFAHNYPILTDWLQQDQPESWKSYFSQTENRDADINRIEKVIEQIAQRKGQHKDLKKKLNKIKKQADKEAFTQLYLQACERRRELRLQDFLAKNSDIIFAQHHNFKMSFIGYTEGLSDARHERFFNPGAKLQKLSFDGMYAKTPETLIDDPYGMIRDVDASKDGKRILFSWKKSDRLDDYHIYQYHLETNEIQQVTRGLGRADYEPSYLPDGDILFASTRPEQSVPCWWTEISNLYRMNTEGQYLRRLAIDQVHTLYPTVLENGRIIYTRWDYSDRGQNYPHPLFNMNPDGTDQRVYYGGNSWFPTSLLHARAIPGTEKVMAIAAGHHTRQHGKLVVLDVSEGRDEGKGMHFVAPKREVPYERVDRAQQYGDQFRYPYPISEEEFLISYAPENPEEQLPGNPPKNTKYMDDVVYGLYWMDTDGNRELIYQDNEISVGRPVMLKKPSHPPLIKDTVDYTKNTGVYYVHDVYEGVGLKGIERGTAKKMRVVRLNYRAAGVGSSRNEGEGGGSLNSGPVSIGNGSWDIKEILGDVDIHEDGSVMFEVPAMESIYLQVLDDKGRVVQTTRSWDTVRPGEKKACTGCHAKENANFHEFKEENTLAWKYGVQQLQPFYGETRGFSFIKEVQPILDANCVSCHDGSKENVMSLKGSMKSHGTLEKRTFSESYLNLTHAEKVVRKRKKRADETYFKGHPENEVVNWISKMSKPTELEPYSFGAAKSGMMHMIEKGHYDVELTEEEYHKMAAWMDLLVPFIGEYREANDWTDEEMAFYNYYEHKRREHKKEEVAHIQDWLKANGQEEKVEGFVEAEIPQGKGYHILPHTINKLKANSWKIAFNQEVMLDKIEIMSSSKSLKIVAEITLSDQSIIQKDLMLKNGNGILSLDIPQNTQEITLKLGEENIYLQAVKVWGVDLKELPNFETHHPYLQLAEQEKVR